MNDEEAAFLAKICAEPGDDTHRLVYADWLEEHGKSERAEFIRVQIEREAACRSGVQQYAIDTERQRIRALKLLRTYRDVWFFGPEWPVTAILNKYLEWGDNPPHRGMLVSRGFVDDVTCTAADWLTHGDEIRVRHPVTRARLKTRPVFELAAAEAPPDGRKYHVVRISEGGSSRTHSGAQLDALVGRVDRSDLSGESLRFEVLSCIWPGVTFELPALSEPLT